MRRNSALGNEVGEAGGERLGLAGAGACQDPEGAVTEAALATPEPSPQISTAILRDAALRGNRPYVST
jgi:hypothetical protein